MKFDYARQSTLLLWEAGMLWIDRVFARLTVLICRGLATDSTNVALARAREERPRAPIPQSGAFQTIHRIR